MNSRDIANLRLRSQRVAGDRFETAGEAVSWLGAVQAQDYLGALWAVGVRMREATEAVVERAIAEKSIVRTWPMRGTLHFVSPADVRWMLALLAPRVISANRSRYRQLGLDEATFDRSREVFASALQGGKQLTRDAMYQTLEEAGIDTAGQRGIHILGRLSQDRLLCFAARQGKQQTFALLEEWVPPARTLEREEALGELARRYFTSHGPATVHDFTWWAGLTVADARLGIELAGSHLERVEAEGKAHWLAPVEPAKPAVYLLPPFDESTVAYKDRSAVLQRAQGKIFSINGIFYPTVVIDGQVVGTWKRSFQKGSVVIALEPFTSLTKKERQSIAAAAERYAAFLGLPFQAGEDPTRTSRTW